ncbi:alpha/beta fold hydrolase [Cryobacterium sp. Hz7]|uniref:alpha/beta fold hydrolase n=1 Tax=Cryobacterium sp. Hz7 TaxID=1259166 RepID=UPI00106B1D69|nr:alpha/beta hydrolase [Cryobacterium sp. Hz7]TFB67190.1 alpha/beta fold hydrolase [Cryobacterium sp. Hz7]
MWVSDSGEGPPLLVLHPGGTDSRAIEMVCAEFSGYRQLLVDRPGHGRSADMVGPWSFAQMADAMAEVLDDRDVDNAHVLGWSDGAIVGLYLALRRPDLVSTLVFGGAAFHHDGWLDGVLSEEDPPKFMGDSYAELSPDGADHWAVVVRKAVELHQLEPDLSLARLSNVKAPVLIIVGDDDEVQFSHLLEMYGALPNAELAVVPRSTHGLIIEKPDILARFARDLHRSDRTNGVAPLRRT